MDKKKFKDTKFGKLLLDKIPNAIHVVGDLLPDKGLLGVVKNLIDKDDNLSVEDRKLLQQQLVEVYELEVRDRESARTREVEVAKTGRFDIMFNLTGMIGLLAFVFMVYAIVFLTIPEQNKEMWIHLIGIVEGIVISIFGYFYGSSVKKNIQDK